MNGSLPPVPVWSVAQPNLPALYVRTDPPWQVVSPAPKKFVVEAVVAKKLVEVASVVVERVTSLRSEKELRPVKELSFARRVDDAAVTVIFPEPSKETPLIVRAF